MTHADPRPRRGAATRPRSYSSPRSCCLVMLVIQFGLWYHAQHVAQAAADKGAGAAAKVEERDRTGRHCEHEPVPRPVVDRPHQRPRRRRRPADARRRNRDGERTCGLRDPWARSRCWRQGDRSRRTLPGGRWLLTRRAGIAAQRRSSSSCSHQHSSRCCSWSLPADGSSKPAGSSTAPLARRRGWQAWAGRHRTRRSSAEQFADERLGAKGLTCGALTVATDTSQFRAGGSVTTTITCTVQLSDLVGLSLPGSRTLTASASEPIDVFRRSQP